MSDKKKKKIIKKEINKNIEYIKKNIREENMINDFTNENIFETLFSGFSILRYKIGMYWIPVILYLIILCAYILFTHSYSEFAAAFVAGIIMYIVYFCVDFIYQLILCTETKFPSLIINSLLNSFIPAIFVIFGYIFAISLKDVKECNPHLEHNLGMTNQQHNIYTTFTKTDVTRLTNIHRNNIIVSIFAYIFSIIYTNPFNKKKCNNNNLC